MSPEPSLHNPLTLDQSTHSHLELDTWHSNAGGLRMSFLIEINNGNLLSLTSVGTEKPSQWTARGKCTTGHKKEGVRQIKTHKIHPNSTTVKRVCSTFFKISKSS